MHFYFVHELVHFVNDFLQITHSLHFLKSKLLNRRSFTSQLNPQKISYLVF
jgi:hypothetical protein